MEKSLQQALLLLGLGPKEIRFFIACFQMGPSSVNEVAKSAKIERSTAYLISQDLISKGFIKGDFKTYGKKVFTIEPKDLLRMVAGKQRMLRRHELELEEQLPRLQSLYQASEIIPKVKVYEGNSGLLSVWKDILSTQGEILVWTNQETDRLVFGPQKHINFIEERVKKGIHARVLAVDNPEGQELKKLDLANLRQTKLLPKGTDFSAETYIYDNKIAMLDYKLSLKSLLRSDFKKDIFGIIIESEPIAKSHKSIFEMIWKILH